jgi:hypothetical protein
MNVKPNNCHIHGHLRALDKDCSLDKLDALLSRFNIFTVLRCEQEEIRHSNILAWLFQDRESHGLGDRFLREWLLCAVLNAEGRVLIPLSVADIKLSRFRRVNVIREWRHVDLLVKVFTEEKGLWVIAIENKLRAQQGELQLADYRERVEAEFRGARCLFVFLTKSGETPRDEHYVPVSHGQVRGVLLKALRLRQSHVEREQRVLLHHYSVILEEHCMQETTVAKMARDIYAKHRRAIDAILEYRENPVQRMTDALEKAVQKSAKSSHVKIMVCQKGIVRFLPREWDTERNCAGKAWGTTNSAYLLVEIHVPQSPSKSAWLEIVDGQSPIKWRRRLHEISRREAFPIRRRNQGPSREWMRVFSLPVEVDISTESDPDDVARDIWRSCRMKMAEPVFRRAVQRVASHLRRLPANLKGISRS